MCDWTIKLSCPRCGEVTTPVTHGRPTDAGTEIRAVVGCVPCGIEWMMSVALEQISGRPPSARDWVERKVGQRFTVPELLNLPGAPPRNAINAATRLMERDGVIRRLPGDALTVTWERV